MIKSSKNYDKKLFDISHKKYFFFIFYIFCKKNNITPIKKWSHKVKYIFSQMLLKKKKTNGRYIEVHRNTDKRFGKPSNDCRC